MFIQIVNILLDKNKCSLDCGYYFYCLNKLEIIYCSLFNRQIDSRYRQ